MTFRSPFPDVSIPDVPLTPFLLEHADELRDKPALVEGPSGRVLTYGQLAESVRAVAAGLAARGLGKGDVLAIYSPNVPEYAVALLGVAAAGGMTTTANPLCTAEELGRQLVDSGARFLVTVPQLLGQALDAASHAAVEEVFVFGEAAGATPFAALHASDGAQPEVEIEPAEDVVVLPYSSGTTGLPKGVMLTHRNLVANLCQIEPAFRMHGELASATAIGVLPFFHIYGMVVVLANTLRHGGTVVTMPRFELEQFLGTLQEHRITHAYVVPPIVLALAKHPSVENHDLSALQLIMTGAAPLGAELQNACCRRIGCLFIQGYGMTEASPVTHLTPLRADLVRPGTVGPPAANTECKIVEQTGEVLVRGPQVMKGYLRNPEATAATIDRDGWLHTGDIGRADEDGYLTLVDRLKELIKVKGYQVAPAELEALLLTHPAVTDAAVVGSPDEEAGEVPVAYVTLRDDVAPDAIAAFVAEHVAPYKKVRRVEVVDEIPKSPSGKILRRVLIDRERERAAFTTSP